MTTSSMRSILGHLKEVLTPEGKPSDGQLLQRFLTRRDEGAFAALVRRHGPMILGVCRRILRNSHDAEDAFQATFLVLVRKAPSLVNRTIVGNWLHGVACRTALKARAVAARRRVKERAMLRSESLDDTLRPDWHALLDRELNGLPEKYRTPIILCDLEGKTRREAARLLRCPEGTISGRLSRARALLARRLVRAGVTLSGGAVAVALSQGIAAGVPPALAASTIRAAASAAAGPAAAAGVVSPQVAALSEGVLKAMLLMKLRTVTAILLAVGLLGLGAAGVLPSRADEQPASRTAPPPAEPRAGANQDPSLVLPGPLPRPAFVLLDPHNFEMTAPMVVGEQKTQGSLRFPRQAVQVYDMRGKKIDGKRLSQIHGKPLLALVTGADKSGRVDLRPLSLYLTMFKEDTLLFVLYFQSAAHAMKALEEPVRLASPPLPAPPPVPLVDPAYPPAAAPPPPVFAPPAAPKDPLAAVTPPTLVRIDSTRFKLPYAFSHPGNVWTVELWQTRDEGRTWRKFAEQNSAGDAFEVDVAEPGRHGFTVVPVNSAGVGNRPRPGDLPQVWVEVDPDHTAALLEPECLSAGDGKLLIIRWRVTLKNLPDLPIQLSYAKTSSGPWLPLDRICERGLQNTGHYAWPLPADVPEKLVIRLQVRNGKGRDPLTILRSFQQPDWRRPPEAGILGVEPIHRH